MDRGGLLHEFFTLAIQEISALPIFVGTNPVLRDLSLDATGMVRGTICLKHNDLNLFIFQRKMIRYLSNKRNTYHNCHCDMKLQARNQEMLLQANIQSTTRKRLGNDAFASSEYDGPLISLKSEIQNIRLSLKYIDNIHEV